MIAVFLSPLYLLFILYLLRWIFRWFSAVSPIFSRKWFQIPFAVLYMILAGSLILGFFIQQNPWHWIFKNISNYWLGVLLYIALIVLVFDLIRLVIKYIILRRTNWIKPEKYSARKIFLVSGGIIICLVVGISTYGVFHASDIKKTIYDVTVPKKCAVGDDLTIALVAGHLGYSITNTHMERMVQMINDMNPDLVCIAGDIFDNDYDAIKEPERIIETLQKIKSRYGVYACYGNHDVNEKILVGFTFSGDEEGMDDVRMLQFLNRANITLLSDETLLIEDAFYLCGRKDYSRSHKMGDPRLTPQQLTASLDQKKPIFVIDHQPRELKELAEAGVDVDLSGHTHDGQMFPGTMVTKFFWENSCGVLKKDGMYSVVTSGVGIWGPNMRVGSDSEVVEIRVHFKNE